MERVKVEFIVKIPIDGMTEDQISEWLEFEFRADGRGIAHINPLERYEAEPMIGTFKWRLL
jgi:hypothetical protein